MLYFCKTFFAPSNNDTYFKNGLFFCVYLSNIYYIGRYILAINTLYSKAHGAVSKLSSSKNKYYISVWVSKEKVYFDICLFL